MNYKKVSDTQQIVVRGKDSLARQLRDLMTVAEKPAEELVRDVRGAAEFIVSQLRFDPKSPAELIELTARKALAMQLSDLLKGDESPELKVEKAREFIEQFIVKTEKEIMSAVQRADDRSADLLVRREAGEVLSPGELAYLEAKEAGHGEYTANLLAWRAASPTSLHPEENAFLEAKLMGYSDEAANKVAKLTLRTIGETERRINVC